MVTVHAWSIMQKRRMKVMPFAPKTQVDAEIVMSHPKVSQTRKTKYHAISTQICGVLKSTDEHFFQNKEISLELKTN